MQLRESRLSDLYVVYQLVKRLTTPFTQTDAYKLGIISDKGKVLKRKESLKTEAEKDAWTWLDILVNNLKRMLAKVPGGSNQLFTYAAAMFLLHEPVDKLQEAAEWKERLLSEHIFGPAGDKHLTEAMSLMEDAPANAAGTGNIAGIGVGAKGEPGVKKRKKFAGHEVFEVGSDAFHKSRYGKTKTARYKTFVGEDDTGKEVRDYGRKNPGKAIILLHPSTGAMSYLRRAGKYT